MKLAEAAIMAKLKSEIKRHELIRKMDVPVTSKMLSGTRDELKANTSSLRFEMKANFNKVEARFHLVDARFNEMESRFKAIDAKFDKVDSRFKDMDARFDNVDTKLQAMTDEVRRLGVMIEEQNARNAIVMDGLQSLFERQERIEKKVEALT